MSWNWFNRLIESLKDDIDSLSTLPIIIHTRSRTDGILRFELMSNMDDWQIYYIFCFGWDERFTTNSYGKYLDKESLSPEEYRDILPRNIEERLYASLQLLTKFPDKFWDRIRNGDLTDRLFSYSMDIHAYFRNSWIRKRGNVKNTSDGHLWDILEIIREIAKICISQMNEDDLEILPFNSLINLYALSWEYEHLQRIMLSLHKVADPEDYWITGILVIYIRYYQHTNKILWYNFEDNHAETGITIQEALRKN